MARHTAKSHKIRKVEILVIQIKIFLKRGLGGVSPYKQISDGLSGRINCRNGGCVRTHPMLAVLVQIPIGDLRVLAA